ncbi:hypothetical protein D3C75_1017830 [compost metagenome]
MQLQRFLERGFEVGSAWHVVEWQILVILATFLAHLGEYASAATLLNGHHSLVGKLGLEPGSARFLRIGERLQFLAFLEQLVRGLVSVLLFHMRSLSVFRLESDSLIPAALPMVQVGFSERRVIPDH